MRLVDAIGYHTGCVTPTPQIEVVSAGVNDPSSLNMNDMEALSSSEFRADYTRFAIELSSSDASRWRKTDTLKLLHFGTPSSVLFGTK